jgi:EAL domain-containing protein (putative c-di-GMP-specific phosphodiesterase class I)
MSMSDLEAAISDAVEDDELVLVYQPIVDVPTGAVVGFEALVRWDRPGFGRLLPAEFIPVAETSDLICEIDTWVLNAVAAQLAAWNRAAGSRRLTVSVNVSGRHINAPRIRDDVAAALSRGDIDPAQLVLEITETVQVTDLAIENLHAVRRTGVRLSLDDFGTGYSSVGQLARLPVEIVKIDKSYLDASTPTSSQLFLSIVREVQEVGLPVVAEGVENLDQLELLRAAGVSFAQGDVLGRPMIPAELGDRWWEKPVEPWDAHPR